MPSSSARYFPQMAGREWVPWPRVSAVMGSRMYRPRGTRWIASSRMPSSGGLT